MTMTTAFQAGNAVGHRLLGNGRVLVMVPATAISEGEARRLAWGLLADLAPDEVQPEVVVIAEAEAQRLSVLKLLEKHPLTASQLAQRTGWKVRTAQRRLTELVDDGRASSTVQRASGGPRLYQLQLG